MAVVSSRARAVMTRTAEAAKSVASRPSRAAETMLRRVFELVSCLVRWLVSLASFVFGWLPVGRERLAGDGRRVLVSGCDSGIGLRLAQRLHDAGYRVLAGCLNDDSEGARHLATLCDGECPVQVLPLDVTSDQSVQRALVQGQVQDKGLWGLVNNAGVCVLGEFEWMTPEQVERTMAVNLLGTLRLTKACLPFIRRSKGRVVSLSTVVSAAPSFPCMAAYYVSKAAVESFSRCLRLELARHGAHASVVRPGDLVKHTALMDHQADENKASVRTRKLGCIAQERHKDEARTRVERQLSTIDLLQLAMWDSMDEEQRLAHGPHLAGFARGCRSKQGALSPGRLDDSPLFGHVEHALGSRRPRALYVSDRGLWPLFLSTLALLPTAASDALWVLYYIFLGRLGGDRAS
ncbi:D-beta-hydroxybutyrate dehydrogenase, mitochondrial-like [Dermacentor andersoni]|uniref:D-beta-hydroxybutyrate dehydrogenase, mitochondrial-like n=1 Tax=Dermacentor andersoni TaxID=34620 RepID=UPI0024179888|nr:D-beta-hydroxybutyrate dehydrogenase, mitochondrial-like [Dermacentor andersoni]